MKMSALIVFLFAVVTSSAQVKIHAHNDYEKPLPLFNALNSKVYSVEADIFSRNGVLLVAHSADQLATAKTLNDLYIQPIVSLFRKNKGQISPDKNYKVALMIDVKEGGEATIRQLVNLLKANRTCFDRTKNKHAVQVIISGERGSINSWNSYPDYIFFDGRPSETYDEATLKRVAVISDAYSGYAEKKEKLNAVLDKTHQAGKLFRFWGTPDNEFYWKYFYEAGVDIINTDKPDVCRTFFEKGAAAAVR